MNFDPQGRVLCENCSQPNGPLYVVQDGTADIEPGGDGFIDYVFVCKVCVADIGSWAPESWQAARSNQSHERIWTRI